MLLLSLLLYSLQDFTEKRVENAPLFLSLQRKNLVGDFAIDNKGEVAYHYNTHMSRYRLATSVAKADAEAILFRIVNNKVTLRTTSQAAHATNGLPIKGYFQNFLRVDDWSNVWFSYSSSPYEPTPGPRHHLARLQIDQRGKMPNKSWDFMGFVKDAYFGPNGNVYVITPIANLHYAIVTYKFNGDQLIRVSKKEMRKGVMAVAYDPLVCPHS